MGAYAAAILIPVAALLLGRGICLLCGHEGSVWLAAPVGFAALMIVCEVAIGLPGRGWTAVAAVVVLCAASAWLGRARGASWPPLADGLPVALLVLVLVSLPFLANARVGVLGVSLLNDTHWHLILAQGLLDPAIQPLDHYGPGYPLGPHAVAATFARGLGTGVDESLTAVLMATPILTGLAALGAIRDLPRPRRWLVATLAAIPYLAAAWYIQSAFKEPILSLLLLGVVLALQVGRRERYARPAMVIMPIAVLTGGVLYDYSYPGLLWLVGIVVCWAVAELVVGGGWRRPGVVLIGLRTAMLAGGIGLLVLIVLVAPDVSRIYRFWTTSGGAAAGTVGPITRTGPASLANLVAPLSSLEGLNVWLYGDFRYVPPNQLHAGLFVGVALIVLVFAVAAALDRRDLVWPSALLALGLIYVYVRHTQGPYVSAKALTVPAPILVLGCGAALMRRLDLSRWRSWSMVALGLVSVFYVYLLFASDYLVLSDAQVDPVNHTNELRSLRPLLHGRPTLVTFYDDYTQWELLGVPVSTPSLPYPPAAPVRPQRPWAYGRPYEFDSFTAATLNQFDYVITTRTNAQSQPPPNFHFVGGSTSYEVWKRVGPTAPFEVLPASGQPGATLDCRTVAGRRIARERGFAEVRTAPVDTAVAPLQPGQTERVTLRLAAGEWELSLPFVSQQAVDVRGGGIDTTLPPNLDRSGSIWPVGMVRSTGSPIVLTLTMANPGLISSGDPGQQFFSPEDLIAARAVPDGRISLRSACGRYVDWYQPT